MAGQQRAAGIIRDARLLSGPEAAAEAWSRDLITPISKRRAQPLSAASLALEQCQTSHFTPQTNKNQPHRQRLTVDVGAESTNYLVDVVKDARDEPHLFLPAVILFGEFFPR